MQTSFLDWTFGTSLKKCTKHLSIYTWFDLDSTFYGYILSLRVLGVHVFALQVPRCNPPKPALHRLCCQNPHSGIHCQDGRAEYEPQMQFSLAAGKVHPTLPDETTSKHDENCSHKHVTVTNTKFTCIVSFDDIAFADNYQETW